MKNDELTNLLAELADATNEPIEGGLGDRIKEHIPSNLSQHKGGMDTVSIIIDLRVSKLVAAAVIIITMVLLAGFYGRMDASGGGFFQDGVLMVKYFFTGAKPDQSYVDAKVSGLYENLVRQGRQVVYYDKPAEAADSNTVLMHWKLPDGDYGVIFGDLSTRTISAEELVELQSRMLYKTLRKQ